VIAQVKRGSAWAAASACEAELAGAIARRVPSMERVRFTASGSEAVMMAVRAARAFTGRPLVAKFEGGYHGLHDVAMVSMAPAIADAGLAHSPSPSRPPEFPMRFATPLLSCRSTTSRPCARSSCGTPQTLPAFW